MRSNVMSENKLFYELMNGFARQIDSKVNIFSTGVFDSHKIINMLRGIRGAIKQGINFPERI